MRQIHVPAGLQQCSSNLNIAVANIKLKPEDMKSAKKLGRNRRKNITLEYKKILQNIIEAEDKKKPLPDDQLAELLKEKGYPIARRTIAKYREQLDIPVARMRKKI